MNARNAAGDTALRLAAYAGISRWSRCWLPVVPQVDSRAGRRWPTRAFNGQAEVAQYLKDQGRGGRRMPASENERPADRRRTGRAS